MKKLISGVMIVISLFASQMTQAQGTTYMSNLGQPSAGNEAVGDDSWIAVSFLAGYNADGYLLNSVQLGMTDASGNPSGFTVMLYSAIIGTGIVPGSSLGTLDGSLNPVTAGVYTYTPATDITLTPHTDYYIVVTADTAIANAAYELNEGASSAASTDGGGGGLIFSSSDGSHWRGNAFTYAQFAIIATPTPEPSPSWLLLLGSGVFIYVRRKFNS
jgi:hypothetical protein